MSGFKTIKKRQLITFLFKNIETRYLFDKAYFKNFRTNLNKEPYWQHQNKIAKLRRENNNHKKTENSIRRAFLVVAVTFFVALFNDAYVPWFVSNSDSIFLKITSVGVTGVVMSAPIIFIIWLFRDKNKLLELENARKDTNLKEFQQLQRWATGNIDGNKENEYNKIALQISALHSLRGYLKGEYGQSFRRGAYEIFRASLSTQHKKILAQVNNNIDIATAIAECPLTKQLNIIASEEWFNLLINHDFPTNNISLVGVDLHNTYLHHRTYGKTLDFRHAQLQGADLQKAQLQGADLRDARLQGAGLWGAQLQGAILSMAQLQGANLSVACLQGAILWKAQLQGANLSMAQLQGANLSMAELQGAYVNELFEMINFKERISQRIEKDTDIDKLKKQYQALDKSKKSELIAQLEKVGSSLALEAIERIQSASKTLDLSQAETGKYSQTEADEWLENYNKAVQ